MKKLNLIIYEEDGAFVAQCLNCGVASQGDTYEEALLNIKEAVELYYEDSVGAPYINISSVTVTEQFVNG